MSNLGLYKAFDKIGISYEKTAVGDKYVYANMCDNGHCLGGEQSGHIIFSKYATLDIDDVEKEKVKSVDDSLLYHEFLCYHGDKLFDFTPEIHIDVKDNSKNISETEKEFLCMYEALKIK